MKRTRIEAAAEVDRMMAEHARNVAKAEARLADERHAAVDHDELVRALLAKAKPAP